MAFLSLASLAASGLTFASLDLCADEYLLMFAERAQVASVSFLAKDEHETALAGMATGLPANNGSIESLIKLRPDVLLTTRQLSPGQERLAGRLGMRVIMLPYAVTPKAVANNVLQAGALFNQRKRANDWMARFDALKPQMADRKKMLWIGSTGLSLGPAGAAWLNLAGIQAEETRAGLSRIEQVAASRSPLLISNYRSGQFSRNVAWRDHPLVKSRMADSIEVDGRAFTCSGPMMLDVIEELKTR